MKHTISQLVGEINKSKQVQEGSNGKGAKVKATVGYCSKKDNKNNSVSL